MYYAGLTVLIVVCAVFAVRAKQLLTSVLWLACTSAIVALLLYAVGAYEIAVIELSVGAGLVTILIVFVLNLVGEMSLKDYSPSFKLFSLGTVGLVLVVLAFLVLPTMTNTPVQPLASQAAFSVIMWQQRGLDTMLQLVLLFTGSLGILGLITGKASINKSGNADVEILPNRTSDSALPKFVEMNADDMTSVVDEEKVYDGPVPV